MLWRLFAPDWAGLFLALESHILAFSMSSADAKSAWESTSYDTVDKNLR